MSVVANTVAQHAEEAATLWVLRRAAVVAPHYSLADLAKLDGRVEAHLDGLRIADDEGWLIVREGLSLKESGEVFLASVLAFDTGNETRMQEVLAIVTSEPALASGMVSALGWLPLEQAARHIRSFLETDSPLQRRIGIAASAVHRHNQKVAFGSAIMSDGLLLKARAFRAVGELGRMDLLLKLLPYLTAENDEIRFSAAWSAALLSENASALGVLKTFAEGAGVHSGEALQIAARRMSLADAKAWQKTLSKNAAQVRQAIGVAGAIGDPELVPWLIPQMKVLPLARPAGEAFTMITGVDLAYRDLERKPPEDFQSGPTDDPNDENVEMDPDDNLPWPEPALVQKWWSNTHSQFQSGVRYLVGKPMTPEWLKIVLRDGRQRQRAAAALELAIGQPGTPLFNVNARGDRQIELLGKPGPTIR